MSGTHRSLGFRSAAVMAALASIAAASAPARADGLWDSVLEKMNVKAAPAEAAPAFIERTRPDPAGLGYLPAALPHKVSPLPVKSAAEIEARKAALDTAKVRQLHPGAPKPLEVAKGRKAAPGPTAPAVAD